MSTDDKFTHAQTQYEQALTLTAHGETQAALRAYRDLLHLAPDFTKAHYQLGLLLLQMQDFKHAKIQFKNVLALMPKNLHAQFYLGIIALSEEDYTLAEASLNAVIEQNDEHLEALTNLGVIAIKREQGQTAIAYFTKALAINNQHLEARHNLAATFMHHDRFENALTHYKALLVIKPDDTEYLYNSGVAEMAMGHLNEAILFFKQLLKLHPEHFDALSNLAAIYLRRGQRREAKIFFEHAQSIKPKDTVTAFMLQALSPNALPSQTCTKYIQNLFNQYALYYDEHMQKTLDYTLPKHLKRILETLAITRQEQGLDLGCGTGLSGDILRPFCQYLTGVDISAKMIKIAKNKNIYDELHEIEICHYLNPCQQIFNLVVALDVLPYIGDLNSVFEAITSHLATQGLFIFTTEISETNDWTLQTTARFAHHQNYLDRLVEKYKLKIILQEIIAARRHDSEMIKVRMIVAQRLT